MDPGSRCMSGNTCGCRMSWTYRWAIMVPRNSTRSNRVMYGMASYTNTPAVRTVCQPGAFELVRKDTRAPTEGATSAWMASDEPVGCTRAFFTMSLSSGRQFQQDGATYHIARATIDLLKDTFGDRLISRFGPVNWPLRSCDLTPLDYFLWGYVKSLVYADKPQTLDHLEDNIRRVIADIRPQMLEKVIENWTSRLYYILASRGSHMPEIIFQM
ncbi:DNA-directed RNA polymerase subunit [Trichonephila clavipes]|nr:DNA-directed RNA polymerase subunit [Trichonephila clavipes]